MHASSSPSTSQPTRSARRLVLATLLGGALAVVTACGESTLSPIGVPTDTAAVRGASVDTAGPMLILRVAVSPAVRALEVIYWADSTGGHRMRATADSARRSAGADTIDVPLPRVAAGRPYRYAVRATGATPAVVPDTLDGQFVAASLPADLATVRFAVTGRPTHPLTLVPLNAKWGGWVIVDAAGQVVWHWRAVNQPSGSTRRRNGNFVLNDIDNALLEVTPTGRVVHRLPASKPPALELNAHHDVIPTPQNTLLLLTHDTRGTGSARFVGDAIWEWAPETGALARRWSTFDAMDPAVDWTPASQPNDWVHANGLALGPRGNVLLSMRFLNQVVSISPDWQRLEWRLGGPRSTLRQTQPTPFAGQHNAQELPNGNVLLFDNGWDNVQGARVSRLLELRLDLAAGTATPAWEYRPSPLNFAPIVGGVTRLANGNTFGMFGVSAGYAGGSGPVQAVEVDASGRPQWTLTITGINFASRATPLDGLLTEEAVGAAELPKR